ncbi:uracil-DNA glycosylase [Nocardioides litoris]|uniref:uracil-DNA glycosylase n=1 Tax=Nocardioides litoris TaxID=1926648 RepID=UPI00111F17B3|nr:uracil-DNA glycosylase [Nocardioides litoris]
MVDPVARLAALDERITRCRRCPRLVRWREQVARDKRAAYADEDYWGRPVPGFGVAEPRLLVVGLAPAAHGANRTGRMFTGDRSGDWLFASMHRVGLANQPTATSRDDGLELRATRIVSAVRCAPPDNKPTTQEKERCSHWLDAELRLLAPSVEVLVALGSIGWDAALAACRRAGWEVPRPKPRFGHGASATLVAPHGEVLLLGSYHPSQQNTFTGRLTEDMLDAVLGRAAALVLR